MEKLNNSQNSFSKLEELDLESFIIDDTDKLIGASVAGDSRLSYEVSCATITAKSCTCPPNDNT